MFRTWTSFALLATSLLASSAQAHINLKYPARRPAGDIKIGPCGGAARGATPTVLEPGATITVTWDETIQHPGHFRIAFDADGDDFPEIASFDDIKAPVPFDLGNGAVVLVDNITDKTGPFIGNTPYEQVVTLPNVQCETCTLHLIQVMIDKPPYTQNGDDIYHECADLALRRTDTVADAGVPPPVAGMVAPPPFATTPPPVAGMVALPMAGAGAVAGMTAGTGVTGDTPAPLPTGDTPAPLPIAETGSNSGDSGGCSVARSAGRDPTSGFGLMTALAAIVLLWQRRTRSARHGSANARTKSSPLR